MSVIKKAPRTEQKNLRAIFNLYAQKAVQDFPELEGRLAILDVAGHEYHGAVDMQKSGFDSELEFVRFLAMKSRHAEKRDTSYATCHKSFCLIVFNDAMRMTGKYNRDVLKTLNHELGHLVVPGGIGGEKTETNANFKEAAADVFACLRHRGDDIIDRLAWKRAINFIGHAETEHFTSFALENLKTLRQKTDFKTLTPQQAVELSLTIAKKYSLTEKQIGQLKRDFTPVKAKMTKGMSVEAKMKLVADLVCGDVADESFRAGLAFLKPYFETGVSLKGKTLDLASPYWNGVRKTLKEKELKLPGDNVIKFPRLKP
jgi:hypothetical protein